MKTRVQLLCTGAFAAASLYALPAVAQDVAKSANEALTEAAESEGDIVVTALRVSSLASKTPIALSAITGNQLRDAGITATSQIADFVPNLQITRGDGLRITIRGVTSNDNTEKGDPSTSFLLDGVYISRPQAQEVSFYDVARVEVLRGPQGTLYGRNTTAGVINVITNRPSDRFEASMNATYGNFDTRQADAMINLPVSENIALRFAGAYDRRDSYLNQNVGDPRKLGPARNDISGRAQALIKLGSSADLLIRGDYSSMRGTPYGLVPAGRFFNTAVLASAPPETDPLYIGNQYSSDQLRDLRANNLPNDLKSRNSTWGIGAELNWDLNLVTMTYLGSYRQLSRDETTIAYLGAYFRSLVKVDHHQNSQELRFATNGAGPFKAQFGGYYFREKSAISAFFVGLPGLPPYYGFPQDPTISENYGVFAQGTYSLLPGLRATGGVRYSHDTKSRNGFTVLQQNAVFNPLTDLRLQNSARANSSKVTWRGGLEFDANSRTLVYGSVASGYKAGGFNDGCAAGTTVGGVACNQPRVDGQLYYKPETLISYEVGVKRRSANNVLRLNLSAFYYDYRNLQLSTIASFGGAPSTLTTNAAKASVKGVELEATVAPSPRNRFDLAFTYLDGHYASYFPRGAGTAPDYTGRSLDRAPKTVATAGYTYTLPFANGADLAFNARTRLSSSYVVTLFAEPHQYRQPSFTRTDVNLTFTAPDGRFSLAGFARNLEDNITVNGIGAGAAGARVVTAGDPRTYGVRAGVKF